MMKKDFSRSKMRPDVIKNQTPIRVSFFPIFFIFWVIFQVSIIKMIEKLFRTLEIADDGAKDKVM